MTRRLVRLWLACIRWILCKVADASMGIGCLCLEWEERLDPDPRPPAPVRLRRSTLQAMTEPLPEMQPRLAAMREAANAAAAAMKRYREVLPVNCRGFGQLTYLSGPGRETTCHVRWEEKQTFDPRMVN